MDDREVPAQLVHLAATHEQLPRWRLVGGGDNSNADSVVFVQPDFLRRRVRAGVGDQVLAHLAVDVVSAVSAVERVERDGDAVDQFVLVAGMHQDPHRGRQVIDAVEVAFGEGAEVPQAGVHLLEGFGEVLLVLLVLLGLGVVQSRAVKAGKVLVVGAGPVAAIDPLGKRLIHLGQRRDYPLGRLGILNVLAQLFEFGFLGVEVRLEIEVRQHGFDASVKAVVLHELVIEIERDGEPAGDRPLQKIERPQHGHVRRLDAERVPVIEADVAEWGDLSD